MKKVLKGLLIIPVLVIVTLIISNYVNTKAASGNPQKGDLKCPDNINSSTVSCEEIVEGGVVTEVRLTYGKVEKPGDVQIIKYVRKTEELGRFQVWFDVKGDIEQKKVSVPTYVSVILDMSRTIGDNKRAENVINAVKMFARTLVPVNDASPYFISLRQFGYNNKTRRGLENKNFDSPDNLFLEYDKGGLGHQSQIQKSFESVYNELHEVTGNRYVFLIGDGQYWQNHTDPKAARNWSDKLRNDLGVKFFILRYKSDEDDDKNNHLNFGENAKCYGKLKKICNKNNMIRFICGGFYSDGKTCSGTCSTTHTGYSYHPTTVVCNTSAPDNYYETPDEKDYEKIFQDIAVEIMQETDGTIVRSELKDHIGDSFFLDKESFRYKNFEMGQITKEGKRTDVFDILIDDLASTGWHKTNQDFKLEYTDGDGNPQEIIVREEYNPEVYWIQPELDIKACYGSTEVNTRSDGSDDGNYYQKICNEGYNDSKKSSKSGFKIDIKINNLDEKTVLDGEYDFETKGLGFPATIDFSTNVKCEYKFDVDKFNSDYQSLERERDMALINSNNLEYTEDERRAFYQQYYSALQRLLKMDDTITSYHNLIDTDLENYKRDFMAQPATMVVSYKGNATPPSEMQFKDIEESKKDSLVIDTTNYATTINGKSVISYTLRYLTMSKSMELPPSCLSMKTGNVEECNESASQIGGGNKFYANLAEPEGRVSIEIKNAGMKRFLNFSLGGADCKFSQTVTRPVYRQISLNDPFIQDYDKERGIGENYLNKSLKNGATMKYNFVNVIQSDLWQTDAGGVPKYDFMYWYQLSKGDVANIRDDTSEEGVKSYLGRNCFFNGNNNYVCDFTRGGSVSGSSSASMFSNYLFN